MGYTYTFLYELYDCRSFLQKYYIFLKIYFSIAYKNIKKEY